ncbi:MFS transporter [Rhizosaccharibacter radicis]|uniref:MFS transporter n=1 Tax=Rhizosaccharibacter radicis TaxID=2782605 RepID=A0ABT1VUG0_9PROT|nr:MFS transporter [Acetobacteraceae bacterium KSS12]
MSLPATTIDTIERSSLPVSPLLALAMTGFTAILTETLPAGLLPIMSRGLDVSQAAAGQMVSAYAAGSLVAAIPLVVWTQGFRRRPVLLAAILGFLLFNTATALAPDFTTALFARFGAGVAAGLAWGLLAGYARRMVVDRLKGRALALAMVGTPVALSLGVPAGTFLGSLLGWRATFGLMSVSTAALVAWVLWSVPDFPGYAARDRPALLRVLRTPGIRPVLGTILAWMTAHNILYTFVAPLAAPSGLDRRLDLLLLGFGVSALAGIWLTGLLIDRALRRLAIGSLLGFAVVALLLALLPASPAATVLAVLLWGLSFGGAATQLQTAAGDVAGDGVDLANAMITTTWNAAIAAGGLLGGVLLDRWGDPALAPAAGVLVVMALAIVLGDHRHAFRPGPRAAA